MLYAGRTFAYRSNVLRSATLIERNPSPIGVSSGPLSAMRFRLIESSVLSGIGSPYLATPAIPATCWSQAMSAPDASTMRTVAAAIEGPMPSPGMRVIVFFGMVRGECDSGRGDQVCEPGRNVGQLGSIRLRPALVGLHFATPADLRRTRVDERKPQC